MNQSVSEPPVVEVEARERSKLDQLCNEYPSQSLPFEILDDWHHFGVDNDTKKVIHNRLNDRFITFLKEQIGGFD